eukprot:7267695-Lingulodinium_polyedra.AAC.1
MLGQALLAVVNKSHETIRFHIGAKRLEVRKDPGYMLKGRQLIWMSLEYFHTNQSLNAQYGFQDLQTIKWMGDDNMDD